jgi:DNA-binding MarR family transcriptional regulator
MVAVLLGAARLLEHFLETVCDIVARRELPPHHDAELHRRLPVARFLSAEGSAIAGSGEGGSASGLTFQGVHDMNALPWNRMKSGMATAAQDTKDGKRDANEDPEILLGLLSAIEQDSGVTQRSLSRELGIALGLANAYLKRCAKKGLIKVSQVPLNRYAYYLTPKGFSEKSRLTAEYLTISFNFFRDARAQCAALLDAAGRQGWRRIALVGAGELAEIAVLSAAETSAEIVCVADPRAAGLRCAGLPVVEDLAAALTLADGRIDGILVTDTHAPQSSYDAAVRQASAAGLSAGRVMAPRLLRIAAVAPAEGPG